MVVQGVEVIGVIGETCHELRSSRGEVPLVLAIVVDSSVIVEEVLVFWPTDLVLRQVVDKQVAIGVVVPLGTNAHIEVSHHEIQRSRLEGMMVVSDVIALRTILIDVHIVMMEDRSRADDNSTGYTFKKSLDLWMNGLTAFSVKPLRVASMFGIIFAVAGFIWGTVILLQKFVFHTIEVLGYASLASIMLFAMGVMMIMLGLMGEYIGRMYISMNHIPQYTIKEKVNFDKEEES